MCGYTGLNESVSRARRRILSLIRIWRGEGGGMPLEKKMMMTSMCILNTSNTDGLKENEETLKLMKE